MRRGQRVKAARTIRGGQLKIAKGTAERFSVLTAFSLFTTKYSVRFVTKDAKAVVKDHRPRDLRTIGITRR